MKINKDERKKEKRREEYTGDLPRKITLYFLIEEEGANLTHINSEFLPKEGSIS